jgi:hypothetical protein
VWWSAPNRFEISPKYPRIAESFSTNIYGHIDKHDLQSWFGQYEPSSSVPQQLAMSRRTNMSSLGAIYRKCSLRASTVCDPLLSSATYNFGLWQIIETVRILFNMSAKSDPRCDVAKNNIALIDETMPENWSSFCPRIYAYQVNHRWLDEISNHINVMAITDLFNNKSTYIYLSNWDPTKLWRWNSAWASLVSRKHPVRSWLHPAA